MFGWFKKKAPSPIEQLVKAMYGDSPPTSKPDFELAVKLASEGLLHSLIDSREVRAIAKELNDGPMPYSTHSLALSAALNFFRRPDRIDVLQDAQLMARMTALEWAQQKKIPPILLGAFEQSLYTRYRPKE